MFDRCALEDCSDRHLLAELLFDSRNHSDGDERVSAEGEEVVADADWANGQQFFPEFHESELDHVSGWQIGFKRLRARVIDGR